MTGQDRAVRESDDRKTSAKGAQADRQAIGPGGLLASLQRSVGNQAVNRLVSSWSPPKPPGGAPAGPLTVQRLTADQRQKVLVDIATPAGLARQVGKLGAPQILGGIGIGVPLITGVVRGFPTYNKLTAAHKKCLEKLVAAAPESEADLLLACTEKRFGLDLTTSSTEAQASKWSGKALKQMFPVLRALPWQHRSKNKVLEMLTHYEGSGGYYQVGRNEAALASSDSDVATQSDSWDVAGTPLAGVNFFDSTVRHEVGHAVDQEIGWSASHASESKRGGWKDYQVNHAAAVDDMLAEAKGGTIANMGVNRKADLRQILIDCLANGNLSSLGTGLGALGWYGKMQPANQQKLWTDLNADPIVVAIRKGLNDPWYNHPDDPPVVGKHVYQRSYPAAFWVRYEVAARKRLVSKYQFRAPGEWFAEVYAAYYRQDGGKKKGQRLAKFDSDTKSWFDWNVDRGYKGGKRKTWK